MLFFTSPAKTQDYETPWTAVKTSSPPFIEEAAQLVEELQKLSVKELTTLLGVSEELGKLNYARYRNWKKKPSKKNEKPAILAYRGDIYKQMQASLYTAEQQTYAQESLRILTGLYGVLRPYDLIQAYRLEMNAPLTIAPAKDLVSFWQEKITEWVIKDIKKQAHTLVINLASQEYAKAVQFNKLPVQWYTVEFRQKQGSTVTNTGILAKKARGMMIEHLIRSRATTLEQVKMFVTNGYAFTKETNNQLFFTKTLE